ncbi:hypothetical protein BC826DRAFT_1038182, partial [Russula brevipes]
MSGDTDEFGFRNYHQSDVIIGKANRKLLAGFQDLGSGCMWSESNHQRYDGEENRTL